MLNDHLRQALEDLDVPLVRKLWAHIYPNLPQPHSDAEALVTIHYSRTLTNSIEFKKRAYSHCWLSERSFPTGLPDHLKPKAERLYPRVVSAVGIATKTREPLALAIRGAMMDAVQEAYADNRVEPAFVKQRITEARSKVLKGS